MATNITMKQYDGNSYQDLYPRTSIEQVDRLNESLEDKGFQVGDIKQSIRDDLGENWHLCDGSGINRRLYPNYPSANNPRVKIFDDNSSYNFSGIISFENNYLLCSNKKMYVSTTMSFVNYIEVNLPNYFAYERLYLPNSPFFVRDGQLYIYLKRTSGSTFAIFRIGSNFDFTKITEISNVTYKAHTENGQYWVFEVSTSIIYQYLYELDSSYQFNQLSTISQDSSTPTIDQRIILSSTQILRATYYSYNGQFSCVLYTKGDTKWSSKSIQSGAIGDNRSIRIFAMGDNYYCLTLRAYTEGSTREIILYKINSSFSSATNVFQTQTTTSTPPYYSSVHAGENCWAIAYNSNTVEFYNGESSTLGTLQIPTKYSLYSVSNIYYEERDHYLQCRYTLENIIVTDALVGIPNLTSSDEKAKFYIKIS